MNEMREKEILSEVAMSSVCDRPRKNQPEVDFEIQTLIVTDVCTSTNC